MDTLGEHCFLSEQAAVNYALEHPDILQVPTMSAVPLSKKASSSRNGSSSQSAVDILAKKKSSDKRQQNLKAPATESNLQKAFGVENANSWWQRHKVPGIKDTKRSLEKFGMTHPKENGHAYKMPNGTICKSVPDLQKYLCKHGLPANASTELSEDELSVLMRWISIAHLPRYVGTVDLYSDQGQKALMDLPGGESFSDADALKILRDECGAEKIEGDGSFFVPFEDKDSTRYKSIADIRQYIRANGIKLQGWGTPNELIICVLLWASVLPVPIEKVVKKECNNTEEEEDTNEGGAVSTILSSMFSWLSWRKKAPVKSE